MQCFNAKECMCVEEYRSRIDKFIDDGVVRRLYKRAIDAGAASQQGQPWSLEQIKQLINCDANIDARKFTISFAVNVRIASGLERVLTGEPTFASIGVGQVILTVVQKFTFCALHATVGARGDRLPITISALNYRFDQPKSTPSETSERSTTIEQRRIEGYVYNLLLECCSALATQLQVSATTFCILGRIRGISVSWDGLNGLARVCVFANDTKVTDCEDTSVNAATHSALRSVMRRLIIEDIPHSVTPICAAWENWFVDKILCATRSPTAGTSSPSTETATTASSLSTTINASLHK